MKIFTTGSGPSCGSDPRRLITLSSKRLSELRRRSPHFPDLPRRRIRDGFRSCLPLDPSRLPTRKPSMRRPRIVKPPWRLTTPVLPAFHPHSVEPLRARCTLGSVRFRTLPSEGRPVDRSRGLAFVRSRADRAVWVLDPLTPAHCSLSVQPFRAIASALCVASELCNGSYTSAVIHK